MNESIIGIGWSFPPTFDRGSGEVRTTTEQAEIEQSLKILLTTRPGERLLRPRFGINLDELLFENVTLTLITDIKDQIETAIILYEPRIRLLKLDLQESQLESGLLRLELDYEIERTNSRYNFVYPFYLNEKTESLS